MKAIFDPFVSFLYATPRVALLPLIIIWLGIGINSKIALVFSGAVFAILLSTVAGNTFQTDKVFVGVMIVACAGLLFTVLFNRIEGHFQSWKPHVN